jgi:hypothetical protein
MYGSGAKFLSLPWEWGTTIVFTSCQLRTSHLLELTGRIIPTF